MSYDDEDPPLDPRALFWQAVVAGLGYAVSIGLFLGVLVKWLFG